MTKADYVRKINELQIELRRLQDEYLALLLGVDDAAS